LPDDNDGVTMLDINQDGTLDLLVSLYYTATQRKVVPIYNHNFHQFPVCGDGLIGRGETCDDGNAVSGDGCSSTCQLELACEVTIRPRAFNQNTGKFTAHIKLPEPFRAEDIITCYADGAPAVKINVEDDNSAVCLFNRSDITHLPVDVHFEVWGTLTNGMTFFGEDTIDRVIEDKRLGCSLAGAAPAPLIQALLPILALAFALRVRSRRN